MKNPFETKIELGPRSPTKESREKEASLFKQVVEALEKKESVIAEILGLMNQEERTEMDQILNLSGLSWKDFEVVDNERKPAVETLLREWLGTEDKEQKREIGRKLIDELAG